MKMNTSNIMFLMIMTNSVIMTLSSNNIMFSWMSMELNLISFIPLISQSKKMSDQMMKYLIIQSSSSSMMIMSIMINTFTNLELKNSFLLMMSMTMKMGMMPLHLWLPSMMTQLSWKNCLIMSTMQKFIPMIMTSQLINMNIMIAPTIMSLLISPILGMKQVSTKKIMAYSSISNMPWMLMSIYYSMQNFMMFMLIYSITNFMIMEMLNNKNINFINQIKPMKKSSKLNFMTMMLSMSGMPPTMGFYIKWIVLNSMMENNMIMISMSMIISSTMLTYMYLNMSYSSLMMMTTTMKKKNMFSSIKFMIMNMTMILTMMMIPL